MIIVFTGNGKGKTTAALGQAVRTLGRGKNVLMTQFIKGPWKSGEDFVDIVPKGNPSTGSGYNSTSAGDNKNLSPLRSASAVEGGQPIFKLVKMGLGFVGILGDKLPKEEHAKAARQALEYSKAQIANGGWHMIILDEINVAVSLGLLTAEEVLEAVKDLPAEKFVIFTGRGAPKEFIDRADLVTEMKEIKHPFNDGRLAKITMEF